MNPTGDAIINLSIFATAISGGYGCIPCDNSTITLWWRGNWWRLTQPAVLFALSRS